jgi:hypothetical protein
VPFLLEEHPSFQSNKAKRSADEINREVMPVLDSVIISNLYGFPSYDIDGILGGDKNTNIIGVNQSEMIASAAEDPQILRVGK